MQNYGVSFNLGSAKVYSPAIFETCFSYDKDMLIAATDYYMYLYTIIQCPLIAMLQSINFYRFIIFTLVINGVILLLNCLALILYHILYLNIIWTFT